MKIRPAIRAIYADNSPIYEALKARIDVLFRSHCNGRNWHYESRVKAEDSFALKVETGRVGKPGEMEDFFASTLVVRNSIEIDDALRWVLEQCVEVYRRPKTATTAGRASNFDFDDLRLFVKLKASPGMPELDEFKRIFEVQIRTFLFHAWSIATHDLVYKSDVVDWGRARIAFQVRAMLEQAEVAIRSAEQLAELEVREDRDTADLKVVLNLVVNTWDAALLPRDKKRLAENILKLSQALGISLDTLTRTVQTAASTEGIPVDVAPYQAIVNWLLASNEATFRNFIAKDSRTKLVIYEDLSPPAWLRPPAKNVLMI